MHPLNLYPNPLNEMLKKGKDIFLCGSILVAQTYTLEVTKSSSLLQDTIVLLLLHPIVETRLLQSHLHSFLHVKKLRSAYHLLLVCLSRRFCPNPIMACTSDEFPLLSDTYLSFDVTRPTTTKMRMVINSGRKLIPILMPSFPKNGFHSSF
jgi:hypothetical protein